MAWKLRSRAVDLDQSGDPVAHPDQSRRRCDRHGERRISGRALGLEPDGIRFGRDPTQENGLDFYRAGGYLGAATLSYTWPDQWGQTTLSGSASHANRNDVKFLALPALVTELLNTNSDLYRVSLQHLFPVKENFAIGPIASFLHRDRNSYDAGFLQYVPAKDRTAAGALARYAISDRVTLNFRGEHVWVRDDERIAPNGRQFSALANGFAAAVPVPAVSSTGWVVVGGVNASSRNDADGYDPHRMSVFAAACILVSGAAWAQGACPEGVPPTVSA